MWPIDDFSPVDATNPLTDDRLNDGRVLWLAGVDAWAGGGKWFDFLGRDGTLTNGPAWAAGPWGGRELLFDGTDDYVTVPTSAPLNPPAALTVACTFRLTGVSGTQVFCRKGFTTNIDLSYILRAVGTNLQGSVVNATGTSVAKTGSATLVAGTVYRAAVTYDGAGVQLYLNGSPDGSAAAQTGAVWASTEPLTVGATRDNSGAPVYTQFLGGRLGDLTVLNRAWSAGEAAEDYRQAQLGWADLLRRVSPRAWSVGAGGTTYTVTASGGAVGSGSALLGWTNPNTATGGAAGGGSAGLGWVNPNTASGGATAGGSGSLGWTNPNTGAGGCSGGGTAALAWTNPNTASGGAAGSGTATYGLAFAPTTGSGGAIGAGSADVGWTAAPGCTGGVVGGGSAGVLWSATYLPSGGAGGGGSADVVYTPLPPPAVPVTPGCVLAGSWAAASLPGSWTVPALAGVWE